VSKIVSAVAIRHNTFVERPQLPAIVRPHAESGFRVKSSADITRISDAVAHGNFFREIDAPVALRHHALNAIGLAHCFLLVYGHLVVNVPSLSSTKKSSAKEDFDNFYFIFYFLFFNF